MEIEPIYIVGDFSVRTDGSFEKLEKDAVRYYGDFVIDKPAAEVKSCPIWNSRVFLLCRKAEGCKDGAGPYRLSDTL